MPYLKSDAKPFQNFLSYYSIHSDKISALTGYKKHNSQKDSYLFSQMFLLKVVLPVFEYYRKQTLLPAIKKMDDIKWLFSIFIAVY